MFRYISVIIILTVLGILYEKYKLKFMPDEELQKYDLIRKYLLNGDEDLGGGSNKKANRFKPVVIYLGPFKLEKGQTKTHSFEMPN